MSTPPAAIERLRSEVHASVIARGFETAAPHSRWTGKYNVLSWLRRTWKEDAIRLGWRGHAGSHYFLDAQWSVPMQGGELLVAAGINPQYLRRGVQWQSWPRRWPLIGALIERRWRAAVLFDLEFALAWLERCASPAGALQELKNPKRNGPQRARRRMPGSNAAYARSSNRFTQQEVHRAFEAMLTMKKLDIAALKRAYDRG